MLSKNVIAALCCTIAFGARTLTGFELIQIVDGEQDPLSRFDLTKEEQICSMNGATMLGANAQILWSPSLGLT